MACSDAIAYKDRVVKVKELAELYADSNSIRYLKNRLFVALYEGIISPILKKLLHTW